MQLSKNLSTITKTILTLLLVTSNISVTKVYAEEETSSVSSNTTEVSSKDYSEFIQSEVTYNEDKSIATVVISVDTEDDVKLDFSNNDTITEYMESSFSEVNPSDDEKSYTFNIVKNETYTFDAIVLASDADATSSEAIGKKTITLNIDGLPETEDNTNQYEANEAASFTFSPISISNVEVAYFNWHSESDTTGTINFTKVADDATSLTVDNFRDASNPGYILFFVTPKDNHLFTGLGASGAGQAWVVGDKDDETFSADDYLDDTGGIGNWKGIKNVILAARKAGYVACFGFSRPADGTDPANQNFDLTAKVPTMTVRLILDHSDTGSLTNLLPGNKLYFQVVVTPETVTNATVQNVKLTSVHGETVDKELKEQSDGTYTNGTNYIEYVITDDDWLKGRVEFTVDASVSYLCSYGLTKGTISTTSTITESDTAEADPNPEYKKDVSLVKYAFQSADGSKLPDTVTSLLPSDETVELNTTVTPTAIETTKISVDNGYWEFTGWNPESSTSSSTPSIITFTGTWKFKQSINPDDQGYGQITVSTLSDVTYNGLLQQYTPTVTTEDGTPLTENTDYTISFNGDTTNVGTVTVTVNGIGSYSGTVTRTYQIKPATFYVTTPSDTKVYDGTALTKTEGASITGLVNNETATLNVTGSQTAVGSSNNTYQVIWNGTAKESNYTHGTDSDSIGTLTVSEYAEKIVVTTTGGTFTYDGLAHAATVTVSKLPKGYTLVTATSNATATDVTTADVVATCDNLVIKNAANEDVTNKLNITKVDGTIKINPASLTVTTPSDTKVYDGTALTKTEGASITGLVNNETATLNVTGSQLAVGSSKNTYEVVWGTATSSNYTVVDTDEEGHSTIGTLTVTGKSIIPDDADTPEDQKTGITVTTPSNHKYDSNEYKEVLTVTDTKIDKTLVEKTDYTVTYTRDNTPTNDFTNVGTITITIEGIGNYTGKFTRTYDITQRNVTINALPASKVYGADNPNFDCIYGEGSDSIIGKDLGDITVSRTSTSGAVGTYKNDLKVSYTENSNYKVVTNPADFVISAQSIIPKDEAYSGVQVNSPENSKYDGNTHEWSPTVTTQNDAPLTEGTDYTVTYSRGDTVTTNFTNVGEITVYITGINNYSGTVTRTYQITKRNVTLTSETASKTYDGTPLTKPNVTIGGDGFVDGEVSNVTATGSVTNVSESPVTNTITYTKETNYNDDNYSITKTEGTLSVIPQSISPKDKEGKDDPTYSGVEVNNPQDVTYDGNEHKFVPEVTKPHGSKLEEGKDYTVTYTVKDPTTGEQVKIDDFTNVNGEITVTITGKDNYSGTITKTYEITPKPVTITVDSASKVYDKLDPEFTATQEGLVKEDDLGTITAYRTNKDVENAGTYREVLDVTYTSNTNYTVTVIKGDFTIIPQSISPKDKDGQDDPTYNGVEVDDPTDVIYDGKEHKFVPEVTKPDGTKLEEGKDYTVTYTVTDPTTGEQVEIDDFTNVNGEITVTITGKDNYSGTIVKKYSIKQREIEFVGNSATKVYNGKEQAVGGYTIKLTDDTHGLVSGHTATLSAGASRKDEGTSTGSITSSDKVIIMNGEEDVTKNYKITTTPGSITIKCSGWDDGGPFTTDTCGNVFDRWGNKIYEATSCNVGGYNLVRTSVED